MKPIIDEICNLIESADNNLSVLEVICALDGIIQALLGHDDLPPHEKIAAELTLRHYHGEAADISQEPAGRLH